MTLPVDLETDAARLRAVMVEDLALRGELDDPGWRAAVGTVPRHRFVPGFALPLP